MDAFYQTYVQIFESIDEALKKSYITPSLILLYSSIDTFGYLVSDSDKATKKTFINWVNQWMEPDKDLGCSALDLYAARCSVLHTISSESDISKRNEAKKLFYSYGDASNDILQFGIDKTQGLSGDTIAVKVERLIESFKKGLSKCFDEVCVDEKRRSSFEIKARKIFKTTSKNDHNIG